MQVPLAAQATSVIEFHKLPDGHQALPGHKAAAFSIVTVAEGSSSLEQPQTVPQQWRQVALLLAAEEMLPTMHSLDIPPVSLCCTLASLRSCGSCAWVLLVVPVTPAQHLLQVASELSDVVRQGACPVAAVCGSKGTGKSTMARLLCNALLDVCPCVGFLETDCGQAEHTVPGKLGFLQARPCPRNTKLGTALSQDIL